ncbi:alpha-tocopherol transfer protein-like [Sabethes cyaneus]|uniref:alpha-tocopherol transfer protein-like n=1 Tax=Sabethes cyaneus TaxID=53552 RepID=UPI00237D9A9E|nr:alpha-tocopherol transfer protein-like [Sabethes cyaneus]
MSLRLDSEKRPFIELSDGSRIHCFGDISEEMRSRKGECREFIEMQFQEVVVQCLKVGYDVSTYRKLVLASLRYSQYDVPKAVRKIVHSANTIRKYKLYRHFDEVRHVFDEGLVWYLPVRGVDDSVGIVLESGKTWNTDKVSLLDLWEAVKFANQAVLNDERVHFGGVKLIIDFDGLAWNHVWMYTSLSAKVVFELQHCRIVDTTVHVVNNSSLFSKGHALLTPLLGKELTSRLFLHGRNWSSLHQHISASCLPPKYGGSAVDYDHQLMGALLDQMKSTFPVFKP